MVFTETNLACFLAFEQWAAGPHPAPRPAPPHAPLGNTHTTSVKMKQESGPTGFLPCLLFFILWLIYLIFTRKIFMTPASILRFIDVSWPASHVLQHTSHSDFQQLSRYSFLTFEYTLFSLWDTLIVLTSRKFAQGSLSVLPSFLRHLWFITIRVSLYSCSFMCLLLIPWNNQTNQNSQKTAK